MRVYQLFLRVIFQDECDDLLIYDYSLVLPMLARDSQNFSTVHSPLSISMHRVFLTKHLSKLLRTYVSREKLSGYSSRTILIRPKISSRIVTAYVFISEKNHCMPRLSSEIGRVHLLGVLTTQIILLKTIEKLVFSSQER